MANLSKVLHNYYGLIITFFVFICIIIIGFLILKRKNTKSSKLLYGLFMDYNSKQILALTLIIMNFIILVYYLVFKINLNIPLIVISMLFIVLAYLINLNFKYLFINSIINIVNLGILYFASLIGTLKAEVGTTGAYILQLLIIIFGFLFYLFATFKFIYNIRQRSDTNDQV